MDERLPPSGSVLGVDVGFSSLRRSSAVCRLDWSAGKVSWELARFRAIEPERETTLLALADRRIIAAAFDGPLAPGFPVIGRYRAAERLLTRALGPLVGKPGSSGAPVGRLLNAAANQTATIVAASGQLGAASHPEAIHAAALVEAFPNAFLGVLLAAPQDVPARRANRSDVYYHHLAVTGGLSAVLSHLLPGRAAPPFEAVRDHDERAALICALTALAVAAGDYVAAGDQDGWIVLPPAALIRSWAMERLDGAATQGAGDLIRRERGTL